MEITQFQQISYCLKHGGYFARCYVTPDTYIQGTVNSVCADCMTLAEIEILREKQPYFRYDKRLAQVAKKAIVGLMDNDNRGLEIGGSNT